MSKHKPTEKTLAQRHRSRLVFVVVLLTVCVAAVGYVVFFALQGPNGNVEAAESSLRLEDIPFNGAQAYQYLQQLCALGPRPSGSSGMASQQKLLAEHFQKCGGRVYLQRFRVPHPATGKPVPMANMIVRWRPQLHDRILLCAHYDTLPYPMLDRENPRGVFVGANDGASGVAVLMELAQQLNDLAPRYGVDIVLFDGEEFIFKPNGRFFLGSEYFARKYAESHPPYRYRWGVLLDMIGDKDLQIYQERNSAWWKDTRPLVEAIWATAARLGVREFIAKKKHTVDDDHVPLHNIGKIPCIDVIDFDYPPWHTRGDTPEKCSALSLAKVGWVVSEWLRTVK